MVSRAAKVSLAVFLAVSLATGAVGCAHAPEAKSGVPGGGAGVSLARDWVLELSEGNVSQPLTRAKADGRYLRLTGGTLTGALRSSVSANTPALALDVNRCILLSSGSGTTCNAGTFIDNDGARTRLVNGNTQLFAVENGSGLASVTTSLQATNGHVQAATDFRSPGVATASLPTCNSGAAGRMVRDTTRQEWVRCEEDFSGAGTYNWNNVGAAAGVYSAFAANPGTAGSVTLQQISFTRVVRGVNLRTYIGTAGVGAGNMTVTVYDATAGAAMCTETVLCTASGAQTEACSTALTGAQVSSVELRVDASGCGTSPQNVNVAFVYR